MFCISGVKIMHMPIKSRWKSACWACRPPASSPSLVLMNSRCRQEAQVRPLGSLMISELSFMNVLLVLTKHTESMEGRRPAWNAALARWLIQLLAVGWLFTAYSMPHSCKKPSGQNTKVICFASFHWQRAQRCLHGWITTGRQWFGTMLHTPHTV